MLILILLRKNVLNSLARRERSAIGEVVPHYLCLKVCLSVEKFPCSCTNFL